MGPVQCAGACHTPFVNVRNAAPVCWALCVAALLLGWAMTVAVPPGLPYDEPAHHVNVEYYAHEGRLPVLGEPGVEYEGQMGPLYYTLAALALHATGTVEAPFAAIEVLRTLGLVLVPLLGWLTHRLARSLGAGGLQAALAAGLVVLNPTLLAVGSSVQNDHLSVVLGAAGTLLVIGALREGGARRAAVAGAVIGVAVLAKVFAGVLLLGFLVALVLDRDRAVRARIAQGVAACMALVVVCGWWFLRNLSLYGDLTGAGAVGRTGATFPPLAYEGLGSVLGWGRSLISYAFAPTEYYRNTFEAPVPVRVTAVFLTLLLVAFVVRVVVRRAKGGGGRLDPPVVFAVSSVLAMLATYAVAAWTLQAIAPRLVAVVVPLAVALLARVARDRAGVIVLAILVTACFVLDLWLLTEVAAAHDDLGVFPWGAHDSE